MKKNETILKTVFLFLFAVFLLQGCRTEIETTENANSQTPPSKIKINRITKEQFDKNETLKINLDKFLSKKSKPKTSASREIYNEYYDFSIITDDITEVNNSGTKTYTFLIKRDENQQGIALENLLMYPDKEGYNFSLIQYKLSDTEYKAYLKGEKVDFKGKVNVVKLASDKISISARLFPCWETYSTWVPYDPDAPPRYIYYPDGSYRIDTDGHYEYVTTLGTCDDGQTGFTGSVSTVPTGGGIASGTTADLKILLELIKKMYNSNAAEYNKVQWLLSSGELQDFLKIYIGPYYEDSGKTTESVLFSKFLTNFCYENRDYVTKEQVYNWFSLNETINISVLNETILEWDNPYAIKPTVKFMQNERLKCLYNKIKKIEQFNNILQKFDVKFSTKDLIFDYGKVSNPTYIAETSVDGNKVKIKFNEDLINTKSNLFLVTTFIHEAIHAEIYRILMEKITYNQTNGSTSASYTKEELKSYLIEKKYNKLWDYFSLYGNGTFQHEYMANFKVNTMINFLSNYDNSLSDDTKNAFAWITLMETIAWNKLSNDQINKYKKDYIDYEKIGSKTCN